MNYKKAFKYFFEISIVKTVYLNYKCFNLKTCLKLPILIHKGTKIKSIGIISISCPASPGLIIFGKNCKINNTGNLIFNGKARIGPESHIFIDKSATLSFGSNFAATEGLKINCAKRVTIGSDCLFSWGIQIIDTDFHKIITQEIIVNENKDILIGNHIWLGFNTTILKGTTVTNNVIVGAHSLLNKVYNEEYVVYAGNPAKVVKREVSWDY